jgi:RND family efflux transporter MFP subunit
MKSKSLRITAITLVLAAAAGFVAYRALYHAKAAQTVRIEQGAVELVVAGPGTVQARIPVVLSARTTAVVTAVHADQGSAVRRGQLLATLDDRDLAARHAAANAAQDTIARNIRAAEASLAKARADLELARGNHQRDLGVFKAGYISRAAIDATEAALRSAEAGVENAAALLEARRSEARASAHEARYAATLLDHTRILAPMDGIIIQRSAEIGSTVVPGSAIFRMVDPSSLWVATRVDESIVGLVEIGMSASIRLRTGATLPGKVARIARQSDAATRELEVDVAFDAPPQRFAIDQEAQVEIRAGREQGLVAPVAALVQDRGRSGVLVVRDGRSVFRAVETGPSEAGRVVIRKGVEAGDAVIARPQGIRPGERVRAPRSEA